MPAKALKRYDIALASLVGALPLPRPLARRGDALADYPQGADLQADRRLGRGADDLACRSSLGGVRNWDYRYCWLRDATFTLNALLLAGYNEEAAAWREWLLRAVAGSPKDLQIVYGVTGARRLDEIELPWLPGYEKSKPVRIGNAASKQFQLDVYGEVMDSLHLARAADLEPHPEAWNVQLAMLEFLESHWEHPDEGIWEVRGPRKHFTHSKIMAWVAFDRAIKDAEKEGLKAPVARWRRLRDRIHAQVCEQGFDRANNTFVQSYESKFLDASLLLIPQVGFLPAG